MSENRPVLNEGIVLKYSANQKYTTDGVSAALWKQLCEMQMFCIRPF